ncbi:MAG: MFS transporter, partial [Parvularculaceae bacterium]|nr:MFS transporter [Parvularculaceae bacterium]
QIALGAFTTSPVYTRPVAERFVSARGLAFSIVMTGPPLAGALVSPLLSDIMDAQGWRAGYQTLALVSAVCGLAAIALLPPGAPQPAGAPRPKPSREDYRRIAADPAFWVLFIGMFLVNLPQTLATSQLAVMLAENGALPAVAARMISAYALGVIIGRFCSGLALDRFPAKAVAVIGLGLPGLGMLLLASPLDATFVLALAVLFMGLAQGAEGDVAAFLAARHFDLSVYSLVTGLVSAGTAGAASFGAILLSLFLRRWDAFSPFLIFGALATFMGAGMFLLLDRRRTKTAAAQEAPATP